MRSIVAAAIALAFSFGAHAQPAGCPYDGDGDGRVDIEDLYHLTQNPADINGDGFADAADTACLEAYLRCIERLDMSFRPGEAAGDGNVPSLEYIENSTAGGLTQTLSVVRLPSPDGIGCVSQNWTTTLLGTRPGLAGPVEIRLDRDGFLWQGLFADAASASPGMITTSGMLTCDGSAIELVATTPGGTIDSGDELRVLVLLDGQSVTDMAVAKGVADAASRDIGGGLIDAYSTGGVVTLPTRGMLVLFELDSTAPSDPAFAFDDAAVLVEVGCGDVDDATPQEVVIRDSIGPDSSMTDGGLLLNSVTSQPSGTATFPIFELNGGQDGVRLTQVDLAMRGQGFSLDWNLATFRFHAWSSLAAADNNRFAGDVYDAPISVAWSPSIVPGSTVGNLLAIFELADQDIHVAAGQTIYFAIVQTNPNVPSPGIVGIPESNEPGASDYYMQSGGVVVASSKPGMTTGRFGARFVVVP